MNRQLVTLAKVLAVHPIEGADAIERIQVKGWNLVSKKGNFQVGDLCAYFEIDSFLPIREEFEFLRKSSYRKLADGSDGFRLKTIKLRGQVSQGLALPISEIKDMLPEGFPIVEGAEITEHLGVVKFDPPIPAELAGVAKGPFPSFIPKTDEERVQNLQQMLDENVGEDAYDTEKVDGSSETVYLNQDVFGVCTRNLELLEVEGNSLWRLARELKLEEGLRKLGRNLALQGEIYGEGINGNKLKRKGQHFALFSVFDIDNYCFLDIKEMLEISEALGIKTVPIVSMGFKLTNNIDDYIRKATRKSLINPDVLAEGIVIRTVQEKSWRGSRVSFKAINQEFLIKFGSD